MSVTDHKAKIRALLFPVQQLRSKRLYADFYVMRDEEKSRRLFTDSVGHLQLDVQIDIKWSKQSKAEVLHLLSKVTFLHPLTSTTTLAVRIHISNTF